MGKFGVVPPEPKRQDSLAVCAPKFAQAVRVVLEDLKAKGFDPLVYETMRTPERQSWLAGFGVHYDDGRGLVTHATNVYQSWHAFGTACDIISYSREWDAPSEFWNALGHAAIARGLAWGGLWHMRDLPHIQWGGPMRVSPSDRALVLLKEDGLEAVWKEVKAI